MSNNINVDDTTRCPIGPECGACERTDDLAVVTFSTPMGVFCGTLCAHCATLPPFRHVGQILAWPTVARLVASHCAHLGIDLDQMADALEAEQPE